MLSKHSKKGKKKSKIFVDIIPLKCPNLKNKAIFSPIHNCGVSVHVHSTHYNIKFNKTGFLIPGTATSQGERKLQI